MQYESQLVDTGAIRAGVGNSATSVDRVGSGLALSERQHRMLEFMSFVTSALLLRIVGVKRSKVECRRMWTWAVAVVRANLWPDSRPYEGSVFVLFRIISYTEDHLQDDWRGIRAADFHSQVAVE